MFALSQYLQEFDDLQKKFAGPVQDSLCFGNTRSNNHLVVIAAIHGNETGSIPVIVDAAKKLATSSLNYKVTFLIGNRLAVAAEKRYVHFDLNRIIKPTDKIDFEHRRAQELLAVIQTASVLIDLHQTSGPTLAPFYIFTPDNHSLTLAGLFKGSNIVVEDMSLEKFCEMSAVEFAQRQGTPAVAIELGQKGLSSESFAVGLSVLNNAFDFFRDLESDVKSVLLSQKKISDSLKKLKVVIDIETNNAKDCLIDGLKNLSPVSRGQIIGKRADGQNITVLQDGYVLFPKYPKRAKDLTPIEPLGRVLCSIGESA